MKLVRVVRDVMETKGKDGWREYHALHAYASFQLEPAEIDALRDGAFLVVSLDEHEPTQVTIEKEPRDHRVVPGYEPGAELDG